MIVDVKKFISSEKPYWEELNEMLILVEKDPHRDLSFGEIKRLHYLHGRASAGLVKINTFAAKNEIHHYLEALVGRCYTLIYGNRGKAIRFSLLTWFRHTFPQTFRRHASMFVMSLCIMLAGVVFGAAAIVMDPSAKAVLMPFDHLQEKPGARVAREEASDADALKDGKAQFSAYLITHNTRVSIFAMALGMTWGVGTAVLLFTNGVMLGAIVADYLLAGEPLFLTGWLLPHGAIEIPSILIAGQAGLLLAAVLMGGKSGKPMKQRLRDVGPDLITLIGGVGILLVWAGLVEAFLSQYHAPVIPYGVKILFGVFELCLLIFYLVLGGRNMPGKLKKG